MSSSAKKPRIRGKNFSLSEEELIKTEVIKNFDVIMAKHCNGASPITKRLQDQVWQEITQKVNSIGIAKRSVIDIKEKWRNLTKKAKTEVSDQKRSMVRTGGGPPIPLPNPVLTDIAEIFSNSASFHGIPGAGDAKTIPMVKDSHSDLENYVNGSVNEGSFNESNIVEDEIRTPVTYEKTTSSLVKTMKINEKPRISVASKNTTVKEAQLHYYQRATENMEAQTICYEKIAVLADVLTKYFSKD